MNIIFVIDLLALALRLKIPPMLRICFILVLASFLILVPAQAALVDDIVNPANTRAITNAEVSASDYVLEWVGEAPKDVTLEIDPESVEWMRVREVLVLPRARAIVKTKTDVEGLVRASSFVAPILHSGSTHFPIALLASEDVKFGLELQKGVERKTYSFVLKYVGRGPFQAFYDSSCSRFGIEGRSLGGAGRGWMSVGCVVDPMASRDKQTTSLELQVVWQRESGDFVLNSLKQTNSVAEVLNLRLAPNLGAGTQSDEVFLEDGTSKIALSYRLPNRIYKGHIGLGVGPYIFDYEVNEVKSSKTILMPTFYASYATSATTRLVAFEATPLAKPWTTDLGVYLSYESFKFFDRRLSLQVLLGGHLIAFDSNSGYKFLLGAPQGAEIIGTDIFMRGYNMALGAFIFPWIGGKAYNNLWVRYGTRKIFAEINYIMWKEEVDNVRYRSSSLGVTVGMPIPALSFL